MTVLTGGEQGRALVRGGHIDEPDLDERVQQILRSDVSARWRAEYATEMMRGHVVHNDTPQEMPVFWHRLFGDTIIQVGVSD